MNGPDIPRTAIRKAALRWVSTAAAALGTLALLSCAPSDGDHAGPAPSPTATVDAGRAPRPEARKGPAEEVSLADFPEAIAQLERLREGVERIVKPDEVENKAIQDLEKARTGLHEVRGRLRDYPIDEVAELHRATANSSGWISAKDELVTSRLRRVERRIARVAELKATISSFSALAEEESAPPGIRTRVKSSLSLLEDLNRRLVKRRSEILVGVDKLAEVRGALAAVMAEAEGRIEEEKAAAERLSREPIWQLRFSGLKASGSAADRLGRDLAFVRIYLVKNASRFLLLSLVVFGATAALAIRLRRGAALREGAAPSPAQRIRKISWVAAVPVAVVLLVLTAPPAPPSFYMLALLPAAPAAAWTVVRILGPGMGRTVWVLAASVAVLPLRGALESFPLVGRVVFLLQTVPLAAVLVLDFRAARWRERIPSARFAHSLQRAAWLFAAILAAAAAGAIGGWVSLSARLGLGALGSLAGFVMVAATYLVLVEVLRAGVASSSGQALLSVRSRADDVLAFGTRALRVIALFSCALIALVSFELLEPTLPLLRQVFRASATVGSMTISLGSVLSFVLVLSGTLVLARVVSFVLDQELLPRLQLGRGAAYAVSVSTRYLLLFCGFVIAAGAAGIDLSKIGFLAGAFGVGMGIGLQNVVGNFVSGLILLFERPIQVGDTVDVAGAVGTVTHIGIRASTVRSADGAEVVVPNADLISKPLINWTLSDRHRRYDVVVGVAYGSPLEGTAQALLAAAKRTRGIKESPAPEAFFQTFAASSLDWALRIWVLQDDAPQVLSGLKRAISEELERAGIEIPFPQQEIRIRSVAPEARQAGQEGL